MLQTLYSDQSASSCTILVIRLKQIGNIHVSISSSYHPDKVISVRMIDVPRADRRPKKSPQEKNCYRVPAPPRIHLRNYISILYGGSKPLCATRSQISREDPLRSVVDVDHRIPPWAVVAAVEKLAVLHPPHPDPLCVFPIAFPPERKTLFS